jgi:mannose-6-phosphate isomerase-like protein (cupin superfamily)
MGAEQSQQLPEITVPLSYDEPPYVSNLTQVAMTNKAFRRVLRTDGNQQLVVMSLPPFGQIGYEAGHPVTTQTTLNITGHGYVQIGRRKLPFNPGDIAVIPRGTAHNVVNTSDETMSIAIIYSPPHHPPAIEESLPASTEFDLYDQNQRRRRRRRRRFV